MKTHIDTLKLTITTY